MKNRTFILTVKAPEKWSTELVRREIEDAISRAGRLIPLTCEVFNVSFSQTSQEPKPSVQD